MTRESSQLGDNGIRALMVSTQWPTPERPYIAPFLQEQVDSLLEAGVDAEVSAVQIERNLLRVLPARRAVRRRLRTRSYDVVHVHFGSSAFLLGGKKPPLVVT